MTWQHIIRMIHYAIRVVKHYTTQQLLNLVQPRPVHQVLQLLLQPRHLQHQHQLRPPVQLLARQLLLAVPLPLCHLSERVL